MPSALPRRQRQTPPHTHAHALRLACLTVAMCAGTAGCKENAPVDAGSSNPELGSPPASQGAPPDVATPQAPPPPPAKAVEAHADEGTFTSLHRLTFDGHAEQPRFTGDGKAIVFIRRDKVGACPQLAAVDLEGRPIDLAKLSGLAGPDQGPDPGPDQDSEQDQATSSFDGRGDLWVAAQAPAKSAACADQGAKGRSLASAFELLRRGPKPGVLASDPAWDGSPAVGPTRVVFSSMRSGDPELWSVARDGSDPVQLTSRQGLDIGASFAPAGEQIVWTASRPQGVDQLAAWAQFQKDARVPSLPTEIRSMRADGTGDRPLTDYGANSFAPRLSAEGWLWFTSNLHDAQRRDFDVFRKVLVGGGPPERVTHGPGFDGQADLHPTQPKFVFVSDRGGEGLSLYLAELPPAK